VRALLCTPAAPKRPQRAPSPVSGLGGGRGRIVPTAGSGTPPKPRIRAAAPGGSPPRLRYDAAQRPAVA